MTTDPADHVVTDAADGESDLDVTELVSMNGSPAPRWERTRPLPGIRPLRTTLRTAHLLAFGALYGGHVYGVEAAALLPALLGTVASGGGLVALEMYRTPVWPLQLRGLATFAKVILVAAVAFWWEARIWLLTAAVIIGSISSHMPGRLRYYSVLHRRAVGGQERG